MLKSSSHPKLEIMNDYITIRNLDEARRHTAGSKNPILFVVEEGNVNFCGLVIDETFGYRVGNRRPNIERMIRDFRSHESSRERTPLVLVSEGISIPPAKADGAKDGWVVHSTDAEAGESVLKMQHLCSRQSLRERGVAFRQFGRQELGEPVDYSDLINFAPLHQSAPEVVVASPSVWPLPSIVPSLVRHTTSAFPSPSRS